jgi:hypothetical protein
MTKVILSALVTLIALACCSCGGSSASGPPPPVLTVTGNYSFVLGSFGSIGGFIHTTAGNIAGTMDLFGPAANACLVNSSFNVFGTVKPDGAVSLQASAAGAFLTIDGSLGADGSTIANASFAISGVQGCVASGQASGVQVQDLNGTYAGTLTLMLNGAAIPITWSGPLSQTLLDTGFIKFIGGPVTVGGVPAECQFTTTTFSDHGNDFVFGLHSSGDFAGNANGFIYSGDATDANAKTLNLSLIMQGGPCSGAPITGSISRP